MPKDPKRNLQRYQTRGGHLNEFEFQKSQTELAEDSYFPFRDQTDEPGLNRVEGVGKRTPDADRKVEKRKNTAASKAGGDLSIARGKTSPKKGTKKSVQKMLTPSRTKDRGKLPVEAKKSSKTLAKPSKKTTQQASTKRRA